VFVGFDCVGRVFRDASVDCQAPGGSRLRRRPCSTSRIEERLGQAVVSGLESGSGYFACAVRVRQSSGPCAGWSADEPGRSSSRQSAAQMPTRRLPTAQHGQARGSTGSRPNLALCSTIAHGQAQPVTVESCLQNLHQRFDSARRLQRFLAAYGDFSRSRRVAWQLPLSPHADILPPRRGSRRRHGRARLGTKRHDARRTVGGEPPLQQRRSKRAATAGPVLDEPARQRTKETY
jgi:hypothetical protein